MLTGQHYYKQDNYKQYEPAKVGIKSCRFARECVSFMHGCTYPAGVVFA